MYANCILIHTQIKIGKHTSKKGLYVLICIDGLNKSLFLGSPICNVSRQLQQLNPVGGKACSPIKGCLLHCALNTYSLYKVSNLKFAHLFIADRYISSLSEKTRPKSWPGNYSGLAVVIITLGGDQILIDTVSEER